MPHASTIDSGNLLVEIASFPLSGFQVPVAADQPLPDLTNPPPNHPLPEPLAVDAGTLEHGLKLLLQRLDSLVSTVDTLSGGFNSLPWMTVVAMALALEIARRQVQARHRDNPFASGSTDNAFPWPEGWAYVGESL